MKKLILTLIDSFFRLFIITACAAPGAMAYFGINFKKSHNIIMLGEEGFTPTNSQQIASIRIIYQPRPKPSHYQESDQLLGWPAMALGSTESDLDSKKVFGDHPPL